MLLYVDIDLRVSALISALEALFGPVTGAAWRISMRKTDRVRGWAEYSRR